MSRHKFDLNKARLTRVCPGGNRHLVNQDQYPALHNMAMATISLKKGGVREPHWHPNANEMTYCAEGKALITLFSPENIHDTFTLSAGEVVYFPRGYIHHIENIHHGVSRFILAYDNGKPEDLDLSETVNSMSAHVLAATFTAKETVFQQLKKSIKDAFITQRKTTSKFRASISNQHKLDLERISPQIKTKGGLARIANKMNFPLLEHLALFSLRIAKNGIREPHWHPNATELNYVVKGKAKLTIYSPGGDRDTFELSEGQGSVIPAGYFHHIENASSTELHMTVFFNNAIPNDIGLSGALSAYSKEVLASLFALDPKFFAQMHKFQEDRMIVSGGG
jgi:oxalate decarboxylase